MADARYIPKKTKVKMEFAKGITLSDILMFFLVGGGFAGLMFANFSYHIYIGIAWLAIGVAMFFKIEEGVRLYSSIVLIAPFFIWGDVKKAV